MSFADEWAANEDQLFQEAGSLGELLARMKGYFSSLQIDPESWDKLVESARELPPTLAGFPLWVGFPIDESNPAALLDLSLLGGTQSAAFFKDKVTSNDADPSFARIASLLGETGVETSSLQRIVGDRVLLQYDIDPKRQVQGEPGIFLYPIGPTLINDLSGERIGDFQLAFNAVMSAMNREPDETECRHAERAYLAMEPDTRVGAIGVIPSRGRFLRLAMLGFVNSRDIMAFLERTGWPGRRSAVANVLERLEARGALSQMQMGVRIDVGTAGLEPTLDLQIFSANTIYDSTGWFKDKACWKELIDGLREECLAIPERLSGLAEWSSGAKTLIGRSGPFLLLQRIHHFEIVLTEDGVAQVNAYVFLLMARWPRSGT